MQKIENTILVMHRINPVFLKFGFVVKIVVKTFQNIHSEVWAFA